VSPLILVLLGAVLLILVIAVLVYLHGIGVEKTAARFRAESKEFAEPPSFRWDDQKKR
jgi:type II secretory pathway component PulL